MKKFYSFLFAAVALVGFAACNSDSTEEPAPAQENVGKMEFTANVGEDTKTSLDGMSVKWCETDKISINGVEYSIKEGSISADGKSATFVGEPVEAPYFAVYGKSAAPYEFDDKKYVTVELVANVAEGTFADGANIAVAYSEEEAVLSFKNMLSVLKFQVAAACESVTFTASDKIVGSFNISQDGEFAAYKLGEESFTLTGNFEPGKDYYTTVVPGTYALTIRTNGYLSTTKDSKKIVKNKIYNLGTLPAPVASGYNVVGSFQGWKTDEGLAVVMYNDVDGWAVAKGIELYKSDEFKIVKGNTWDVSYGFQNSDVANVDEVVTLDGTQNLKAATNGLFDFYFNGETQEFKYTCVEEYTGTVDITIDNKANWSPLYITLKDGENVVANNATVTDNKFAVSMNYIGSSLSYTLSNGTKTMEGNVTITKDGATINLEETVIKLKVQLNTDNAKQWWGDTMKIHAWNTGTSFDTSWPGNTMTNEGEYTWSIVVPSELVGKTINYLVHNGNGWQSNDTTVTISAEGNTVTGSSIGIN